MSVGIYALYFEQDDSKVYVGQSTKIEDRYTDHLSLLERGKHH
jgi:predicted GIY-YIG superfamily endonuclease